MEQFDKKGDDMVTD